MLTVNLDWSLCSESDLVLYEGKALLWDPSQSFEPRHEKTCLWDFRPGKTQTGRSKLTRKPVFGIFNQVRLKPAEAS